MLPARFHDIPARGVFGHRGTPVSAPENTMPSFAAAVDMGVHGLEFDVRLTSDGEVVVFHDADLLRTTGHPGLVAATRWSVMRDLDAGSTFTADHGRSFPFRDRGVRVSLLRDVLEAFPTTPMIIEVKAFEAAAPVRAILRDSGAQERCLVGAFRHETLQSFDDSGIARCASTREVVEAYLPSLLGARYARRPYAALSVPPVHRGVPLPLRAMARAMAPAGIPLFAWTINSEASAERCWRRGIRAVLSDDPATILVIR